MRADPAAVAAAAARWRDRLADLPRPLTAVLIGGETQPFRFDRAVALELAKALDTLQSRDGGSLYLTTSRRTSAAVTEALAAGLPDGATLHRWQADDPDNPYLGLLGLADRFVVTGDSVSMMVEVARLGRPLAIFRFPRVGTPGPSSTKRSATACAAKDRWVRWDGSAGRSGWPPSGAISGGCTSGSSIGGSRCRSALPSPTGRVPPATSWSRRLPAYVPWRCASGQADEAAPGIHVEAIAFLGCR